MNRLRQLSGKLSTALDLWVADPARRRCHPALAAIVALAVSGSALVGNARAGTPSQASSDNWAGYVVTSRASFRAVTGTWVQPAVSCSAPRSAYSAFWVGLGGFRRQARGLEQIGTEADCRPSGAAVYTAWYELLPAPAIPLGLAVRPGDQMSAQVILRRGKGILRLQDLTTAQRASKTVRVPVPDVSSAEWIAEAPAACSRGGGCQTLPLANFGSVDFSRALATTSRGHLGTISDPRFGTTRMVMDGGPVLGPQPAGASASAALAQPSTLSADGSQFSITFNQQPAPPGPPAPGPAPMAARHRALQAPALGGQDGW